MRGREAFDCIGHCCFACLPAGELRVWDLASREMVVHLKHHSLAITDLKVNMQQYKRFKWWTNGRLLGLGTFQTVVLRQALKEPAAQHS